MLNTIKIIIAFLLLIGCDPVDNRFEVRNNSDKTIFLYLSKEKTFQLTHHYINPSGDTIYTADLYDYIRPNSIHKESIIGVGNSWKMFIETFPDSTLQLFVFDKETLIEMSESDVITQNDVLKHFSLHIDMLEELKWKIDYE